MGSLLMIGISNWKKLITIWKVTDIENSLTDINDRLEDQVRFPILAMPKNFIFKSRKSVKLDEKSHEKLEYDIIWYIFEGIFHDSYM